MVAETPKSAASSPARAFSLQKLTEANAARWRAMKVSSISAPLFDHVAEKLCSAKDRYEAVSKITNVPWFVIAVIHEREASQSWAANLAQGDPWDKVSKHVPKGQGPFHSWEEAAVNALTNSPPLAARWKDWSTGGTLALLEQYNGLGYARRGLPSPYIWAGTNQYSHGRYIADGHFDPHAVDHQLGCAGLIARMALIDKSVAFA